MARTPLLTALRKLAREHTQAFDEGRSIDEVRERRAEASLKEKAPPTEFSRRKFLLGAAAAGVPTALGLRFAQKAWAQSAPRVAIIGGGISGLSAALTLRDAGYRATIYEALPNRVGGRMLSDTPTSPGCGSCHTVTRPAAYPWLDSQESDVFGEFVDSNHTTMRALATRFGIPLIDLLAAEPAGSTETYHFFGNHYRKADADADFSDIYRTLRADLSSAGYPTTYASSKPGGRALDNMSIYSWIESRVPGGHGSPLGQLLDAAYAIEYGADTREQSALNLIYLLAYQSRQSLSVFGESDERFRLQGGAGSLPKAISQYLGTNDTRLGWVLESIQRRSDGAYTLTFDAQGRQVVTADYVVLTVPFAAMMNVDYASAGFDALKDRAIRELGAGKNGKLHLQFTNRLWNQPGPWGIGNGTTYADTGYQSGWDVSRGQAGASGILCKYTGGSPVDLLQQRHFYGTHERSDVLADAAEFLREIEPVFPGLTARWNGRAAGSIAHLNPYWNCSYSFWGVGQYQAFSGYEGVRQGNVFFAGEHTSQDFQGFMEGGASTGVAAANQLLGAMRGRGRAA